MEGGLGQGITQAGLAIGTPDYMAPEQLMGESVDNRADLYAAGIVLYECVTGRTLYQAPTIHALVAMHLEAAPQDPRSIVPDLPADLAALILRAVAKSPGDRFQTAGELRAALGAVAESERERPAMAMATVD